MINFQPISVTNSVMATANVQSANRNAAQAQPQTTAPVVDFSRYTSSANSTAAMKAQIAASDINFNQGFYNNIQYLNAQASLGIHKQVDGKIFVAADVFSQNPQVNREVGSSLMSRLNDIDNIAKDRNGGSQSLLYTRTNSEKKNSQRQSVFQSSGSKLQNVYA